MKFLLFLLCVISSFSSFCSPNQATRDLIILIDRFQEESAPSVLDDLDELYPHRLGAISYTLLPALYQQAAPILVSRSLVKNILAHKEIFYNFVNLPLTELKRLYKDERKFRGPGKIRRFKELCMYANSLYHEVNKELHTLIKGPDTDTGAIIDILTSKQEYLEKAAPESLRFYEHPSYRNETQHRQLQAYVLCAFAPLDKDHYFLKSVSSDLVLLIPTSFKKTMRLHDCSYHAQAEQVTEEEKKLGIKVNHLEDIEDTTKLLRERPRVTKTPLRKILAQLFVTKADIASEPMPAWNIYCAGHGLPGYTERIFGKQLTALQRSYRTMMANNTGSRLLQKRWEALNSFRSEIKQKLSQMPVTGYEHIICSLPLKEFQELLEFCNRSLTTNLFFYTSCFAGGEHLVLPYQTDSESRIFNYDIVVSAASDAITHQEAPMLLIPPYHSSFDNGAIIIQGITESSLDLEKKCLTMHTSLNFKDFFQAARLPKKDFAQLASLVHPYVKEKKLIRRNIDSLAHVRRAHHASFEVATTSLPFLVVKNHSKITVEPSIDAVLLLSPHVEHLELHKSIACVSVAKNHWHTLTTLSAPTLTLQEIIDCFFDMPSLATAKLIWIKELHFNPIKHNAKQTLGKPASGTLYDVIITRNVCTSDNVKCGTPSGIYFTDHHTICWHMPYKGTKHRTNASLVKKELQALFPHMKMEPKKS